MKTQLNVIQFKISLKNSYQKRAIKKLYRLLRQLKQILESLCSSSRLVVKNIPHFLHCTFRRRDGGRATAWSWHWHL